MKEAWIIAVKGELLRLVSRPVGTFAETIQSPGDLWWFCCLAHTLEFLLENNQALSSSEIEMVKNIDNILAYYRSWREMSEERRAVFLACLDSQINEFKKVPHHQSRTTAVHNLRNILDRMERLHDDLQGMKNDDKTCILIAGLLHDGKLTPERNWQSCTDSIASVSALIREAVQVAGTLPVRGHRSQGALIDQLANLFQENGLPHKGRRFVRVVTIAMRQAGMVPQSEEAVSKMIRRLGQKTRSSQPEY